MSFYSNNSEAMRITSGAQLLVGDTSSPSTAFKIDSNGYINIRNGYGLVSRTSSTELWGLGDTDFNVLRSGVFGIATFTARDMFFATNNTERMRITSAGVVCVGKTDGTFGNVGHALFQNGQVSHVTNSDASLFLNRNGSTGELVYFYSNSSAVGSISTNGTLTSYNVTSDYRLKQDFKDYSGLDLVNKIKTYDYEWKADNTRGYGVIAHELQSVINYAVTGIKDGKEMQQVDYSKIVPVLIKAIQEQQTQIEQLKNK
jgi:hypothetical protein